jgi:hypothetical protein
MAWRSFTSTVPASGASAGVASAASAKRSRRHQKIKRILVAEWGGCCAVCGYDRCVVNLHFHHVVPAEKSFGVTVASGKALDVYRAEARKCVLVCANCHGEIEAGLIPSPPPQARFKSI